MLHGKFVEVTVTDLYLFQIDLRVSPQLKFDVAIGMGLVVSADLSWVTATHNRAARA